MSISLRAMVVSFLFSCDEARPFFSVVIRGLDPRIHLLRGWIAGSSPAMTMRRCRTLILPLDLVPQHADLLHLELDGIAVFEVAADLQPAAAADGARADELARHQRLVLGDMGDD